MIIDRGSRHRHGLPWYMESKVMVRGRTNGWRHVSDRAVE